MPNASFDTKQSRQPLSSVNGPTGMQTRIAIVGGRSDKNCIQARQFQPSWDNTAKHLSYWKISLLMFQKKIMCLSHMNKAYLSDNINMWMWWDSIMFKKKTQQKLVIMRKPKPGSKMSQDGFACSQSCAGVFVAGRAICFISVIVHLHN